MTKKPKEPEPIAVEVAEPRLDALAVLDASNTNSAGLPAPITIAAMAPDHVHQVPPELSMLDLTRETERTAALRASPVVEAVQAALAPLVTRTQKALEATQALEREHGERLRTELHALDALLNDPHRGPERTILNVDKIRTARRYAEEALALFSNTVSMEKLLDKVASLTIQDVKGSRWTGGPEAIYRHALATVVETPQGIRQALERFTWAKHDLAERWKIRQGEAAAPEVLTSNVAAPTPPEHTTPRYATSSTYDPQTAWEKTR